MQKIAVVIVHTLTGFSTHCRYTSLDLLCFHIGYTRINSRIDESKIIKLHI